MLPALLIRIEPIQRLLKRALRLRTADNAQTALAVNLCNGNRSVLVQTRRVYARYEEIRFKENCFDNLALWGDPNGFLTSHPEHLTNVGSFEKCWRLIDRTWWIYKSGTKMNIFRIVYL